jgi:hypothetical protein
MQQNTFWMVYTPQGTAPTKQHSSIESATREAERLARANPGKEFYVLVAIEGRCVNDMQRISLGMEIPF